MWLESRQKMAVDEREPEKFLKSRRVEDEAANDVDDGQMTWGCTEIYSTFAPNWLYVDQSCEHLGEMANSDNRIVVLIDMDCFFCQVETKLQPQHEGKPLAVVQYNQWQMGG